MSRLLLIVAFPFIFFACKNLAYYESNIQIAKEIWSVDSLAHFSVNISDTLSVHNILVNIRNTNNYNFSNLYLFIQTTSPKGATLRDTLELFLADRRGKWLGKGFGRLRDNQVPYKLNIRFPEPGTYNFFIQQGMRTNHLEGINSVGIRIEKRK